MISSIIKGISGRGVRRAERRYIDKKFFVPLHRLSNIEITKYFNYEARFNGIFSRDNLPRIKDGAYVINLDEKKVREHMVFLYLLKEMQLCFTVLLL